MEAKGGRAGAVLRVLADLAPSTEQHATGLTVPTEWFRWLPINSLRLFRDLHGPSYQNSDVTLARMGLSATGQDIRAVSIDRTYGDRLAAIDQVRWGSVRIGCSLSPGG